MSASLQDEGIKGNKPWNQNLVASTIRTVVTFDHGSRPSRYLSALVLALSFIGFTAAEESRLVEVKLPAHFDPFAVGAKDQYDAAAQVACASPKPAGFIGYRWRLPAVASELRQVSGESPGKQIYIAFLKTKYGYQIAALNRDYGTDAQSFTELLESPMKRGILEHDAEFDAPIRRDMLEAILGALRKCDPKHAAGALRLILEWSF